MFDRLPGQAPEGQLSPDGKRAICWAVSSPALRVLNVETGLEEEPAPGHWWPACSLAVSADGHTVASSSQDGTIRLSDVRTGREIRRWEPHGGMLPRIAFAPNGKMLASCAWEQPGQGTTRLWDPATGREVRKWETEASSLVVFAAEGQILFSAGQTRVEAWDPARGKRIRVMDEVPEAVRRRVPASDDRLRRASWQFSLSCRTLTQMARWSRR